MFGGTYPNSVLRAGLDAGQTLTIGAGITVHGSTGGQGGTVDAASALINEGTIAADAVGQSVTITGSSVTNAGRIVAAAGTIRASSPGFRNNGIFAVLSGTTATASSIANFGTIDIQDGGLFNVTGSFTNDSSGFVQTSIAGSVPSALGRISISGETSLDGTIKLRLVDGYVPPLGQTLQVITYGSRLGSFAALSDLDPADGVTYEVVYNAADLTVLVVPG